MHAVIAKSLLRVAGTRGTAAANLMRRGPINDINIGLVPQQINA